MIHKEVNYKFVTPSCGEDDVFEDCNIAQKEPHTAIGSDISGLSFKGCNLFNCDIPEDAIVEDCLVIQKSLCSHLHPNIGLSECAENCEHVVSTDPYEYEDKIVE